MPFPILRLALVLLVLVGLPSSLGAEEVEDEQRAAAAIGRDLLAADPEVRDRALQRLLARIEKGGELAPFLEAMAAATRGWADHRARLLDLWIDKAVHGSAREREQASRLIHALGPTAVERLLEELRHARGMQTDEAPAPRAAKPPPSEDDAPRPTRCCITRIYNVLDLHKGGLNPVEVRSLLQKTPDAIEVKDIGRGVYIVTASEPGHAALRRALLRIRMRQQAPVHQVAAPARQGPHWHVSPIVYRVPRRVIVPPKGQYGVTPQKDGAALPRTTRPEETEVHIGTGMDAAIWMKLLQHGPNGVRGTIAKGNGPLALGETGRYFQGREQRYRKGVVSDADGRGWRIEEGTLQLGVEFDVTLTRNGDHLGVRLVASRSEVAMPMLVDTIQPDPKMLPLELDRPEWIITKARASFDVPPTGGAAFLSLGDLGSTEEEHVIVILRIMPASTGGKPKR